MQQQLNIPLDQSTPIVCEECNHDQFKQVFFLNSSKKELLKVKLSTVLI